MFVCVRVVVFDGNDKLVRSLVYFCNEFFKGPFGTIIDPNYFREIYNYFREVFYKSGLLCLVYYFVVQNIVQ